MTIKKLEYICFVSSMDLLDQQIDSKEQKIVNNKVNLKQLIMQKGK
jgi:hypothetical protein